MMGFEIPGDEKIPVAVRDWNAMKIAIWRSHQGWETAERQAQVILEHCVHLEGCPGKDNETAPCLGGGFGWKQKSRVRVPRWLPRWLSRVWQTMFMFLSLFRRKQKLRACPDREFRMSALVILNAARQFAPTNARRPADMPYFAPSREYFSEVLSTLAAAQAELEDLRSRLQIPLPDTGSEPSLLPAEVSP